MIWLTADKELNYAAQIWESHASNAFENAYRKIFFGAVDFRTENIAELVIIAVNLILVTFEFEQYSHKHGKSIERKKNKTMD